MEHTKLFDLLWVVACATFTWCLVCWLFDVLRDAVSLGLSRLRDRLRYQAYMKTKTVSRPVRGVLSGVSQPPARRPAWHNQYNTGKLTGPEFPEDATP